MATTAARLSKLEKQVESLEKQIADQEKALADADELLDKYLKWNALWSEEVTDMLREINWSLLAEVFDNTEGGNPPQTPPKWPP